MKSTKFQVLMTLAFASIVVGQPQQKVSAPVSMSIALQRSYSTIKADLIAAADKMPESDYSFKPAPEMRSFGRLFGHVANSQFGACAWIQGGPNPNQGNDLEKKTTKVDIQKALVDSFSYCDPVVAAITDQSLVQMITRGQNQGALGWVITHTLEHDNEMYGTASVYLRLKGIVPPSTEREQQLQHTGK